LFRQYGPGNRFRYEIHAGRSIPVGTVAAGEVLHTVYGKVLVLGWKPREISAARGRESRFMARLGHLALVRDLATGKQRELSDVHLLNAVEHRD
jgi:hypothetical protein